ncbi:hypothetical protein LshimejAT787_0802670 [Lyophyllum shimeji]|uniref:Uncharacterized protein n=1 Tax=Lyophyllum shimeji TaxID=47721 RepID=A0A9P3PS99_LYOSH|nr:hypothetical protein LshimejAT787_0802670 [Lyophyllum shimeji]
MNPRKIRCISFLQSHAYYQHGHGGSNALSHRRTCVLAADFLSEYPLLLSNGRKESGKVTEHMARCLSDESDAESVCAARKQLAGETGSLDSLDDNPGYLSTYFPEPPKPR